VCALCVAHFHLIENQCTFLENAFVLRGVELAKRPGADSLHCVPDAVDVIRYTMKCDWNHDWLADS
jgi:hypothetical protein